MRTTKYFLRLVLLILLIESIIITTMNKASAQSDTTSFDTKGKDFWLVFPPNFHIGKSNPKNYYDDSLYIFITADAPTTGVIDYMGVDGTIYNKNFVISDPSKIFIFTLLYDNFELVGYNDNSGSLLNRNNSEWVTKQYFHITSDKEVTVYAHNQANMTSDACLVLPTDILGKDYFVMTYNSDGSMNSYTSLSSGSTPSQFVILGTEDSTNVTIIPREETQYNYKNIQVKRLNKGEAYLVQARISINRLKTDLTGSEVHSDKPVAVFAGHQRSTIPNVLSNLSPTRDYLLEQMPSVETWGQNALLVPYQQPVNISQDGKDIFRIISANDNTELYINDVFIKLLDKGEFYENNLINPAHVKASAPVLVAQFKQSSDITRNISNNLGDPFEMLIPPVEQFMTEYRIINTQTYQPSNSRIVYIEQYVTIVATDSSISSVRLDGISVPIISFTPIPASNYSYANVRVSDGVHTIKCNAKMGVYVYGYGDANSYGYVGGMSMKQYDFSPPQIASFDSCYFVYGIITDSLDTDSKLASVVSPAQTQFNVAVRIQKFSPYPKIVSFDANLLNIYKDGEFQLIATDSMGLYSTQKFEIPGFTISVRNLKESTKPAELKGEYRTGRKYCVPVFIENYGKYPQKINNLIFNNNDLTVTYNSPKTLNPGEIDSAIICFNSPIDTNYIDTLSIVGECGIRKIQAFDITFKGDINKPLVYLNIDSCKKEINILVSDSTSVDFGLKTVEILDTLNCNVTVENHLPLYEKVKIKVIDQNKDAIYHLKATDSAGLVTDIIDTIQGFTITFQGLSGVDNTFKFESTLIGDINCKTIRVANSGLLPFTFDENMYLIKNIIFSMPVVQLPFTILPGDTKNLTICFCPFIASDVPQYDTLLFEFNCLAKEINIIGIGSPRFEIVNNDNPCSTPIKLTLNEIPAGNFLSQNYPNPAEDYTTIRFGLTEENLIFMRIYDLFGNLRQLVFNNKLAPGIYEIEIQTDEFEQGIYIYTLESGNKSFIKTMVIRK